MGITEAIARVRAGAKKAGLESALASLGAGLKSNVIPPPLRPAATRIASLLGTPRTERRDVASLERAVESAHAGIGGAGDVCPFTGLRADGTPVELGRGVAANVTGSADQGAQPTAVAETELPSNAAHGSAPASGAALGSLADADGATAAESAQPAAEQPVAESAQPAAESAQLESAQAPAESPVVVNIVAVDSAPQAAQKSGKPRAPKGRTSAQSAQKSEPAEKGKEKLAGEQTVAKTTARSASKAASKQSNGRAPSNRKK